ncbi:MAG: MarC family protein [Flavobacteriales bacterium]|jgi:multiple antibiotic resistance protein|nr:MarC family protein [Flavobacteriales bacterium]
MPDLKEILSCFMVLFAVIDIIGSIPIILKIKNSVGNIQPITTTSVSFLLMAIFLYVGEKFLNLFGVDVNSFAVAGSFILFFIAMEMVLGIKIFKQKEGSEKAASIVPLAFPIIAGAGTFSTLISLEAEYHRINILIAVALNMPLIYLVLRLTDRIERLLGAVGITVLEKVFGIILLAISVKLFSNNIQFLLQ